MLIESIKARNIDIWSCWASANICRVCDKKKTGANMNTILIYLTSDRVREMKSYAYNERGLTKSSIASHISGWRGSQTYLKSQSWISTPRWAWLENVDPSKNRRSWEVWLCFDTRNDQPISASVGSNIITSPSPWPSLAPYHVCALERSSKSWVDSPRRSRGLGCETRWPN